MKNLSAKGGWLPSSLSGALPHYGWGGGEREGAIQNYKLISWCVLELLLTVLNSKHYYNYTVIKVLADFRVFD